MPRPSHPAFAFKTLLQNPRSSPKLFSNLQTTFGLARSNFRQKTPSSTTIFHPCLQLPSLRPYSTMAAHPQPQKAPPGSWISPITSDLIVASTIGFAETAVSKKFFYHSESRPSEGGRVVVVRTPADDSAPGKDVFGPDWNARSRVHEYGGGAFTVIPDTDEVIFSSVKDGRLYRVALDSVEPTPITPESTTLRYAAFKPHPLFSSTHPHLIAVDEYHKDPSTAAGILNRLVLIDASSGDVTILREGADFYHSPSFGGESGVVTWFEWNHPSMPWESSELFVARLDGKKLEEVVHVAGGSVEGKEDSAVSQPKFTADGKTLFFLWDISGFTLLYKWNVDGASATELAMEELKADLATPDWVFGNSRYVLLSDDRALITPSIKSVITPMLLDLETKETIPIAPLSKEDPLVDVGNLQAVSHNKVLLTGGSNATPDALILLTVSPYGGASYLTIKPSATIDRAVLPAEIFSHAQGLEFEVPGAGSDEGKSVNLNVIFYPPRNPAFFAEEGTLPPAVVAIHGGPTSQALPGLAWKIQYYTSRGYAYLDINYGGSSGYGRNYRNRLKGNWGVVDVSDSVEAVKYCASKGLIDGKRVAITGGSAGGYTVLNSLTKSDIWGAGISSYGIGDLKLLADGTHKFESNYLFRLIGGTPAEVPEVYHDRSPVNFAEKITAPTLLLQGLDDKVVPPDQAQTMVKKIQSAGGQVAAVYYEGEGHGFRQAKNIKDSLDRSRKFLEKTFGIEPVLPDSLAP